ncbi:DnaJ family domain-containing protein [Paenibacillus terrae]|uniref:Molecular chaperone DnaJ n=1 Tax=Paenibacillus terrae TaxID=159743 RepID=A0A0D7WTW2_9BACL|nr:DnaJ family domain-containing protein [Paenibacillus terrae]KJD42600.1 molecular chaperone DnaJ [Paenibacillus terrae]
MGMFSRMAEQKITEAMAKGEFDNLAGAGKPLIIEDLSHVPEELRMSYKLLKNAGILPEELQLQKECVQLRDLLHACREAGEQQRISRKLTEKSLRLRMLLEERGLNTSSVFYEYEPAVRKRLEG